MLVLSRKIGEGIVLNDTVTIRVVEISKGMVKLGIDAPKEMLILREELQEAIKQANLQASHGIDDIDLAELSKKLH